MQLYRSRSTFFGRSLSSSLITMIGLVGGLVACEGDLTESVDEEVSVCDVLRCYDKVCALIDGQPVCICPDGLYDDGSGVCRSADLPLDPCSPSPCPQDERCAILD